MNKANLKKNAGKLIATGLVVMAAIAIYDFAARPTLAKMLNKE